MKEIDKLLQGGWEGLLLTSGVVVAALLIGMLLYCRQLITEIYV
jgi:hypothetical protein